MRYKAGVEGSTIVLVLICEQLFCVIPVTELIALCQLYLSVFILNLSVNR